jgi:hypothetical protein
MIVMNVANCQVCRELVASTDESLGLPLLPAIEEDEMDKFVAFEEALSECNKGIIFDKNVFYEGNKFSLQQKAELKLEWLKEMGLYPITLGQSSKHYSEEDIRKVVILSAISTSDNLIDRADEIIQLLNPKPISVEVEIEEVINSFDYELKPISSKPFKGMIVKHKKTGIMDTVRFYTPYTPKEWCWVLLDKIRDWNDHELEQVIYNTTSKLKVDENYVVNVIKYNT